jgi:hypothetical protein
VSKKLKVTIAVTALITLLSADSVGEFLAGIQKALQILASYG